MPSLKRHCEVGRRLFGEEIIGKPIHRYLDSPQDLSLLGPHHRVLTHTWKRLEEIKETYGLQGYAEALLHLSLDYDLIKIW